MKIGSSKRASLRFWFGTQITRANPTKKVMTIIHLDSKLELSHEFWLIETRLAKVLVRKLVESP